MKFYKTKSKLNCGPSSFINLIGIKGTKKLENALSDLGRLKPFYITDWTSFLIWAERYGKELEIHLENPDLNEKMFKLMKKHEKLSEAKFNEYKQAAKKRHLKLKAKYCPLVKSLKNPLKKLNELLNKKYRVVVSIAGLKNGTPHLFVAFKREKDKYWFIDSTLGIISLTKNKLIKQWKLNKKQGFGALLVGHKR